MVQSASARIRIHRCAPLFKLSIINNEEVLFGFYPVRERTIALVGEDRPMYDLMGKDAILFHHAAAQADPSTGSRYVEQARANRPGAPREPGNLHPRR